MKFVVASYGTRGDIEPCAAVGLELQRRGHDVCLAVPPNLIGFVETAGLSAVAYGSRDSQEQLDEQFLHNAWKLQNPIKLLREAMAPVTEGWAELSAMLTPVAAGADLLLTGQIYQEVVANVAEHHGIPLAALHFLSGASQWRDRLSRAAAGATGPLHHHGHRLAVLAHDERC